MPKAKIELPIREGMPSSCIACGAALHGKSEHYCGVACEQNYRVSANDAPPFLSKWKIRKRKGLQDPLVGIRHKTRAKSKALVKEGRIKRKPCVVCGSDDVLIHHEDYSNPYRVIWMCDLHHKEYHDGKIGLFNDTLWWDSSRLVPKGYQAGANAKKYTELKQNLERSKQTRPSPE